MNPSIAAYFDEIESRLINNEIVYSFRIIRRQVSATDGKYRVKLVFVDNSEAEFYLYVIESGGRIVLKKYSFHWQGSDETLIRRWDNAPHHPNLPGDPHHVHQSDGSIDGRPNVPDADFVLAYIEKQIKS
ncbi:MAG: hypothetical protein KF753_20250 [Caldilineaceae bacterium]|nr:hypothetical protein [Caldilineaceae bacterium]